MDDVVPDDIYGTIEIPSYAKPILASAYMQALRWRSQMSLCSMVWPQAIHSRLDHSLGTMHLALRYAERLMLSKKETRTFALAALLHDVGHAAYSHLFEHAAAGTPLMEAFRGGHDAYRLLILQTLYEQGLLTRREMCNITEVWDETRPDNYLGVLLWGPTGVDRMDHMVRDLHYCFPKTTERILCSDYVALIMKGTLLYAGKLTTTPLAKVITEKFLELREWIRTTIYQHPLCLAADVMAARIIRAHVEDVLPYLKDVRLFPQLTDQTILAWDDAIPLREKRLPRVLSIQTVANTNQPRLTSTQAFLPHSEKFVTCFTFANETTTL